MSTKRQNERENDCCVRNACPNHHGLGAGKQVDEAEPIPGVPGGSDKCHPFLGMTQHLVLLCIAGSTVCK